MCDGVRAYGSLIDERIDLIKPISNSYEILLDKHIQSMLLSCLPPWGVAIETVTAKIAESQNKLLLDKAMQSVVNFQMLPKELTSPSKWRQNK
jgi:hypothetical protein